MLRSVNGRWGKVSYFGKDEYVGRSLHYYGEYNPDETEKILELSSGCTGDTWCLDIGANIGVISQALLASGRNVVAYEPQPEVYNVLVQNINDSWDGKSRFAHFNVGVGSEAGTAQMPKVQYSSKGNFGGLSLNTKSMYGSYEVPVLSIDGQNFTNPIGFMKIDVEGYELEVLKGATETINRWKPILYIEDDRIEKRAALRDYITKLGYKYEMHQPTLYREENFFGHKKNVWDRMYASHNLICTPC